MITKWVGSLDLVLNAYTGLELRVLNKTIIILFLIQIICCGCSKEQSQWDGCFEHPQHMFKLIGKMIITNLRSKGSVIGTSDLKLRVGNRKIFSYFSTKTYVVGTQEHPKHMLKIMGKKIFTILRWNFFFVILNLWRHRWRLSPNFRSQTPLDSCLCITLSNKYQSHISWPQYSVLC